MGTEWSHELGAHTRFIEMCFCFKDRGILTESSMECIYATIYFYVLHHSWFPIELNQLHSTAISRCPQLAWTECYSLFSMLTYMSCKSSLRSHWSISYEEIVKWYECEYFQLFHTNRQYLSEWTFSTLKVNPGNPIVSIAVISIERFSFSLFVINYNYHIRIKCFVTNWDAHS